MPGDAPTGAQSVLDRWDGRLPRWLTERLALCALLLLPLSAAATIDLGFTLTVSYILAAFAVIVGAPSVVRGLLRLPRSVLLPGTGVLLVYLIGVIVGSDLGLSAQAARSRFRDVVYLADLGLGLMLVALLADIVARKQSPRRLIVWLCVGASLAALYAIYQWFAQQYGWPASDVNNTVNSDGVTTGYRYQGSGLLGWERARGTFKEPLLLASHLAIALPLMIGLAVSARGRRRLGWICGIAATAIAFMLTVSVLVAAALLVASLAVATVWAVGRGATRTAATLGAVGVLVLAAAPAVFVDPSVVAGATGRSPEMLRATSANRIDAWREATTVWSQRPVGGYGPGQSSIRLAYRPDLGPGTAPAVALGSAQGLWAAALIDTGLIGVIAWSWLFVAVAGVVLRALLERTHILLMVSAVAGISAFVVGQMSGDRLDLRAWVALGLVLATATATASLPSKREPGEAHR
jgi:O-antigen ligase